MSDQRADDLMTLLDRYFDTPAEVRDAARQFVKKHGGKLYLCHDDENDQYFADDQENDDAFSFVSDASERIELATPDDKPESPRELTH